MRYTVDLAELDAVIGDMTGFEKRLLDKLAELDDMVTNLNVTWTGSAAAAQKDAHARWRSGASEMHHALVEMREAAQRAHRNYSAAADANERMWRSAR